MLPAAGPSITESAGLFEDPHRKTMPRKQPKPTRSPAVKQTGAASPWSQSPGLGLMVAALTALENGMDTVA